MYFMWKKKETYPPPTHTDMCICRVKFLFLHMEYIVIYIITLIKAFLCLIKHHDIECGGGGGTVPRILNVCTCLR